MCSRLTLKPYIIAEKKEVGWRKKKHTKTKKGQKRWEVEDK